MAPRPRNSKGANVPLMTFELVGENEIASKQRDEVPLIEQEVVSRQRCTRQELDPVARMTKILKDL